MPWIRGLCVVLLVASSAQAGPFYIHSQGHKVELTPAPDRIAVTLAPGAGSGLARVEGVDASGPMLPGPEGMTTIPLTPAYRGMGDAVARRLVEAGLAERAGMVFMVPGSDKTFSLDRQVIVRLREPSAASVLAEVGLETVSELGHDKTLFVCRAADAERALRAAVRASGRREVAWAVPDFVVPVDLYHRPNDTHYGLQWHHNQASDADIDSEAAWDVTMGDSGVIVAVIDTGVDQNHPDFHPARIVTGYNSVTGQNDPTPLADAMDGHGTACSGEILATADNGEGVAGVCPGCSLMGIKMMDGMATQTQISGAYTAIEYATDNGAWVLSNSWGIDESVIGQVNIQPFYDAVRDAAQNGAGGQGAVVVFASGNDGRSIGSSELQNMSEVMAVGGTGSDDQRVDYSDYGPNLSVVAPTGAIDMWGSFVGPQICTTDTLGDRGFSRGGYFYTPGIWGDQRTNNQEPDTSGNYTRYFNGTSAACPIAAGVVALAWSANTSLTGAQVRFIVENTADKVVGPYDGNGHSDYYGHGRVNAGRAVRAAACGLDNPDGSVCAEDFNCLGGTCAKASPDDPQGICATPCASDADCAAGEKCASNVCLHACASHGDCDAGAVCQDGACMVVACVDGTECPAGTACSPEGQGRSCQIACTSDAECTAPELCLPALGGDLCQAIACYDAVTCPEGTACPIGGGTCRRTCGSDRDCMEPELCLPALGGDLCRSIACSDGSECPQGTACPAGGGYCMRACGTDADCIPPALCVPAGSGSLCQKILCETGDDCPEGTRCTSEGFCFPMAAVCETEESCPPGWACKGGTCRDPGEGGGGCGCSASGSGTGPGLFLLAFAGLWRRKRSG
jgi:MYXO-CTERM domain-containing protein